MDGVPGDQGMGRHHGPKALDIKNIDAGLEKIKQTKDFWINLEKTPNADNLLRIIKDVKGSIVF